jgi:hypothetical protein
MKYPLVIVGMVAFTLILNPSRAADSSSNTTVPAHLTGELSADEVLNGAYPYPPSPKSPVGERAEGFDSAKLGKVPAPGVHPRILTSPAEKTCPLSGIRAVESLHWHRL